MTYGLTHPRRLFGRTNECYAPHLDDTYPRARGRTEDHAVGRRTALAHRAGTRGRVRAGPRDRPRRDGDRLSGARQAGEAAGGVQDPAARDCVTLPDPVPA